MPAKHTDLEGRLDAAIKRADKKPATGARMKALRLRQQKEGFVFGYINHKDRTPQRDGAVLRWLDAHGYDEDDIYKALNSTCGRHLGDWLYDSISLSHREVDNRIAKSLWETPAAMYAEFGTPKAPQDPRDLLKEVLTAWKGTPEDMEAVIAKVERAVEGGR